MEWLEQANKLGYNVCFVGIILWHLRGMQKRRSSTVVFSTKEARRWGVSRQTKYRALKKLRQAGLIDVEQTGNCAPIVALLEVPAALSTLHC